MVSISYQFCAELKFLNCIMKNSFFIYVCLLCQTSFSQNSCKNVGIDYSGFCQEYHQNGKISWIKEFKKGKATGTWMYFNEKGELAKQLNTASKKDSLSKIDLIYENVAVLVGDYYDTQVMQEGLDEAIPVEQEQENDNKIYEFVEVYAEFPGGVEKLKLWIGQNFVYPKEALELGYQGKVFLKFVVEKNGQISNVFVERGIADCKSCDKEALRLVKSMPNWIPAQNNGKNVRSWTRIPIMFGF
jgi:TonB family protein